MSRLDHDRLTNLLAEVAALPPARRVAFLDSTCLGEPELRRELEELLACADPAAAVFNVASQQILQPDPQRVGTYQILEPIGEGGMAIVYRAQQDHPVRRIVALKLIKLGMDTRQFVARFEAERQALAMMDHPNIAKVHDAGATETGRPYFVMEHVPGLPILEFCDQKKLNLRRRLELFMQVCDAVEHAHRNGIIHRDIKNSNVLVMEANPGAPGVPKVIDFGVAKALSQRLTERTIFTEQGQLIGTPEYMSPEQAERGTLEIDTRSDVYSLGVLLYELISGVQPIPSEVLRSAGFEQVQRIIRETEPHRPSTRLSTLAGSDAAAIAQRRSTALPTLIRDLRRELEWIALKAMRKDREQRYRSPSELADDIRNYLDGRPLIAGPESRAYRARKFLRRHKAGVAASAGMILLLVGGIVATSWQAVRATRAEHRAIHQQHRADREADDARKQAAIARSVNELMTDMIGNANRAAQKGDPNVTVRSVMDIAAGELNAGTRHYEPEVEAALRDAIGQTYGALGLYDVAEPLLRQAVEQHINLNGAESPHAAASQAVLARVLNFKGNHAEAEALHRHALEIRRRVLGDDHGDTIQSMSELARVLQGQGRFAEAESLLREALERARRTLGNEHWVITSSINGLSILLIKQQKLADAEPLCREALARARAEWGDDHPNTISSTHSLAFLLNQQGKFDEAEPLFRDSLARYRRLVGDNHRDTLSALCNLGLVLRNTGRHAEAEPLFEELYRRVPLSQYDPALAAQHFSFYGQCLEKLGRYEQAEEPLRQAYEKLRSAGLKNHAQTRNVVVCLMRVCEHTTRADEAAQWRAKLTELQAATQPATRPN